VLNTGTFQQKYGQFEETAEPGYASVSCQTNAMVLRPAFITTNSAFRFLWPFPDEIAQKWYEVTMEKLVEKGDVYYYGDAARSWTLILKDLTGKDWNYTWGTDIGKLYENFKESWFDNIIGKDYYGILLKNHAVNLLNIKKKGDDYYVTWSDPLTGWDHRVADKKTGKHTAKWDDFVNLYGGFTRWMKMEQIDKK
jgi:hypothetical protein